MNDTCEASTSRAVNFFMSSLFKSRFFIASNEADTIIQAGKHFLKGYARLAWLCHQESLSRFGVMPKCHMMWHVLSWMDIQRRSCAWVANPMAESCGSDEDFIGKFCVLTRNVSPRQRILRSYQRYCAQVMMMWMRERR